MISWISKETAFRFNAFVKKRLCILCPYPTDSYFLEIFSAILAIFNFIQWFNFHGLVEFLDSAVLFFWDLSQYEKQIRWIIFSDTVARVYTLGPKWLTPSSSNDPGGILRFELSDEFPEHFPYCKSCLRISLTDRAPFFSLFLFISLLLMWFYGSRWLWSLRLLKLRALLPCPLLACSCLSYSIWPLLNSALHYLISVISVVICLPHSTLTKIKINNFQNTTNITRNLRKMIKYNIHNIWNCF